jgi:hypothetical protein
VACRGACEGQGAGTTIDQPRVVVDLHREGESRFAHQAQPRLLGELATQRVEDLLALFHLATGQHPARRGVAWALSLDQ